MTLGSGGSWLLGRSHSSQQCSRFSRAHIPDAITLPQTTLPQAAASAVVSYGRDQYGAEERIVFRRDWLVLLPDGKVMFSLGGRAAQGPVSLGHSLVLPLELASPATRTFVLTLDPKSGEGLGLALLRE